MRRHSGTLTLVSQDASQDWTATWSGGATMPTPDEASDVTDPVTRRTQAAILAAADCGGQARVQLTGREVHVLVNLLAGLPLPPPDPAPRHRVLNIRVQAPAP